MGRLVFVLFLLRLISSGSSLLLAATPAKKRTLLRRIAPGTLDSWIKLRKSLRSLSVNTLIQSIKTKRS